MPIFEYLCKNCGASFEKIVPSYNSHAECVQCHSDNIEKQLSVFAVAGPSKEVAFDGPCGTCGAPRPGMCQFMD